jgi:pyrimidine-nucleoside phosphorylase
VARRHAVLELTATMHVPSFIEKKRDGRELDAEEIAEFIRGYTAGEVPDYQAAAWAMAVYFKGMTASETGALTRAMMHSGSVLKHPPGSPPKVDKHSTGGIGDKVSLILAPLLACDGLWVPMISGRGLGITGGTLDKLESIPGFRVGLTEEETAAQLARIGVAMIGQTASICPADKKLYALRDVTATVPSIPLIVASIMSKKLAESLDRLVLDVKFGSGAFMQTRTDAETLAAALCATGRECGVKTEAVLTQMDEPLGRTAGNALEVWEAVETLQGRGPDDLVKLTLDLAERVSNSPRTQLARWLEDGTAWRKWVQLAEAQGGRAADTERILEIHAAPLRHAVQAPRDGRLKRMDAGLLGRACLVLGAGRSKATDAIDFAVGVSGVAKTGAFIRAGDPLLVIHARDENSLAQARPLVEQAIVL